MSVMGASGNEPPKDHLPQPRLHLLRPPITAEKLAAMYKALTGRTLTPEELERAKAKLSDAA